MRKLSDHFKNEQGRPAFHFGVIYADEWPDYGFPLGMTIQQRGVWSYLFHRTESHHCSVSEVSRKVWGSPNHRKTAKATLEKLAEMNLAGLDKRGWFSILPTIKPKSEGESIDSGGESQNSQSEFPDSGGESIDSVSSMTQGGESQNSEGEFHDSGGESIDSLSQLTQGGEFQKSQSEFHDSGESIDSVSHRTHPGESIDSGGVSSTTHQSEFQNSQRDKREIRDKETTTTMRARAKPDLEKYVRHVLRVGVEDAISKYPDLFEEPLQIPDEEVNWHRFVAVGVAVAIEDVKAKNLQEDPPRKTSIGGLIHKIVPQYRGDDERARVEIETYLSAKKRARYLAEKKSQVAESAKINRAPGLPDFDEARDGLGVKLQDWLHDRFPKLSGKIRKIESSTADDLEYLRVRSARMQERFGEMWDDKGSRSKLHAEHVRSHYLQEVWLFAKDLEGVKA